MILFCDTSALMKLYAQEVGSDVMRAEVKRAHSTLVNQLTWVEMHSAFSLKQRTKQVTATQASKGLARLHDEWDNFTKIAVDTALTEQAAIFSQRFGLRAYDSVQLASAHRAYQQLGTHLAFCCFDKQLNTAADGLGIRVLTPHGGV